MLIQNDTFRNVYVADGNTTTFAYTTPILDKSWLAVFRQIPGGEQERVTDSEYSLTGVGNPNAGNVVFSIAPADGTRLAFILDVPISQLHKYAELDSFPAESHEDALAKLTLICQMLSEKLARAIVTLETSDETPEELRDSFFVARDEAATSATAASDSALEASGSATRAQAWAQSSAPPDAEDVDSKSARTWAGLAADSADDAAVSESNAAAGADRAQAWAESPTPPDPEDPDSKSAKTWAAIAADTVPIATPTLAGKVKPDGATIEVAQDGGISVPAATTTTRGTARLATPAEVQAGAAATGSVSPAVLRPEDIAAFPAALGGAMMYNTRKVLTTSGTWTAPVTGWVRMLLIGGGGGSGGSKSTNPGFSCGGGAGEELELFLFLTAGTAYNVTIAAGGAAGTVDTDGGNGGDTSITVNGVTYTSHGGHAGNYGSHGAGQGGGAGLSAGQSGTVGSAYTSQHNGNGGAGGGRGGGVWNSDVGGHTPPTGYGAGASGAGTLSSTAQAGSAGMQGCIVIDYFDPSKAA